MLGIGAYIRRLREERGWTQATLSEETGINRARIAQIEGGRVALPGADARRSIARALGVPHVALLVAAGEITADELRDAGVVGIIETTPDPTRERIHQLIDHTPLSERALLGLTEMLEEWNVSRTRRSG